MYNKLCFIFRLVIQIFTLKIFSHLVFALSSMSWTIGFLRNFILKFQYNLGFFHIVLQKIPKSFH